MTNSLHTLIFTYVPKIHCFPYSLHDVDSKNLTGQQLWLFVLRFFLYIRIYVTDCDPIAIFQRIYGDREVSHTQGSVLHPFFFAQFYCKYFFCYAYNEQQKGIGDCPGLCVKTCPFILAQSAVISYIY